MHESSRIRSIESITSLLYSVVSVAIILYAVRKPLGEVVLEARARAREQYDGLIGSRVRLRRNLEFMRMWYREPEHRDGVPPEDDERVPETVMTEGTDGGT